MSTTKTDRELDVEPDHDWATTTFAAYTGRRGASVLRAKRLA